LRIVSDELFDKVHARLQRSAASGNGLRTGRNVKFLLSGFLGCDSCGANYVMGDAYKYACLAATKEMYAFTGFERVFKDFGLPLAIHTDDGVPFASNSAFFGLSQLSVWWLRIGIAIERIKPGHPQQNGHHERMHLTLKKEATKPPAKNFLQQQAKFDRFIECYNQSVRNRRST
jgi:hypothetical protein